jgi:hypothetical protein
VHRRSLFTFNQKMMKNSKREDITEKWVETELRKRVESAEGMCIKLYCMTVSGLPDRLILMPGSRAYLVETKCIKNGKPTEPSAIQRWMHIKLKKLGFNVWVINDRDSIDEFMIHITKCI